MMERRYVDDAIPGGPSTHPGYKRTFPVRDQKSYRTARLYERGAP